MLSLRAYFYYFTLGVRVRQYVSYVSSSNWNSVQSTDFIFTEVVTGVFERSSQALIISLFVIIIYFRRNNRVNLKIKRMFIVLQLNL